MESLISSKIIDFKSTVVFTGFDLEWQKAENIDLFTLGWFKSKKIKINIVQALVVENIYTFFFFNSLCTTNFYFYLNNQIYFILRVLFLLCWLTMNDNICAYFSRVRNKLSLYVHFENKYITIKQLLLIKIKGNQRPSKGASTQSWIFEKK